MFMVETPAVYAEQAAPGGPGWKLPPEGENRGSGYRIAV